MIIISSKLLLFAISTLLQNNDYRRSEVQQRQTNQHLFYYFEVIRYSFLWLNNTILKVLFITCSSQSSSQIRTKKNPKSITTVGVFKFRRYEKGITFPFHPFHPCRPFHQAYHQAFHLQHLFLLVCQRS